MDSFQKARALLGAITAAGTAAILIMLAFRWLHG